MASALDTATRALETRLQTAFPTTPTAWPNVEFVAPVGELWLRPTVIWGMGVLHTMLPRRENLVLGILQVSVFAPLAEGAGPALAVSDQVRQLYNRVVLGAVRCDAASGPAVLPIDPPWYSLAVTIPFHVEEATDADL